ncbi:MAG: hypothetical protein K0Q71_5208 [Thermomicrobiales bacterium]|nr:hypothetical protein [Thermomicrobiales bacterium]
MIRVDRRVALGGTAALLVQIIRDAVRGPEPARAGRRKRRRKSVKFDISASQFRDDCLVAGGEFADWGDGEFSCCFPGWCQHCSKNTGRCKIVRTNLPPSDPLLGPGNVIDDDPAPVAE